MMLKGEGEKMNRVLKLKIEAVYRDLTAKDKRIADYIVKYPEQVMTLSIRELAQELEVAESTIFRFVQRLGYDGYKQFKLELAQTQGKPQLTTNLYEEISANDSPIIIAQKVFEANTQALIDTQHLLADDAFEEAVRLLSEAKSIFFFGVGGSNAIAMDAYHKFLRSPLSVSYAIDSHIQRMEASRLDETDVALIISHSGQSHEVLEMAKQVKRNQARLIALTSFALSPLAELADVVLISRANEVKYRPEALASRLSQLSIIDALFVNVMYADEEASQSYLTKMREVIETTKEITD